MLFFALDAMVFFFVDMAVMAMAINMDVVQALPRLTFRATFVKILPNLCLFLKKLNRKVFPWIDTANI